MSCCLNTYSANHSQNFLTSFCKKNPVNCCDIALIITSIALAVIGILVMCNVLTLDKGVIWPNVQFSNIVEGGVVLGFGLLGTALTVARFLSPEFKKLTER